MKNLAAVEESIQLGAVPYQGDPRYSSDRLLRLHDTDNRKLVYYRSEAPTNVAGLGSL